MNAESIIPAAGMAERMPICRVLAPASSRRRDTSGKLAPRLKPTTDTANNRPARKRLFITTPLTTTGATSLPGVAIHDHENVQVHNDRPRLDTGRITALSEGVEVWGEGKGEQHTAPTLEDSIARPIAAAGQDDRLAELVGVLGAIHQSVTHVRTGGTLGEPMPPVNSPVLSLQRFAVDGSKIASRPNNGKYEHKL